MDDINKSEQEKLTIVPKIEDVQNPNLRYCKCCGQYLPLDRFNKYGQGLRHICKSCQKGIKNPSEKFRDIESRELIEELRRRGYRGKLTYTETTEVKI